MDVAEPKKTGDVRDGRRAGRGISGVGEGAGQGRGWGRGLVIAASHGEDERKNTKKSIEVSREQ